MQMRSILFYLKLDGTNFYGSKRERTNAGFNISYAGIE